MTAVNHVLAGALIGTVIRQPAIAMPVALASHFVLDALPHFGFRGNWKERLKYRKFVNYVVAYDIVILGVVSYLLLKSSPGVLVLACAALAIAPDLVWIYRFTIPEKWGTKAPTKGIWLTQFHNRIQQFEFKEGIVVEVIATIILGIVALKLI